MSHLRLASVGLGLALSLGLVACGSDAVDGTDASLDSSASDATKDQSAADAKADARVDAALDATADAGNDATTDASDDAIADSATDAIADAGLDAIVVDSGPPPDGGCNSASDCKLFASYCSTAACKCIPLAKSEPNPICNGQLVQCLLPPCQNKTAICTDAGTCALGP